ncbi:F-box/LRR-repeat protein 6 [Malaya genurostris]|uniref:F-box/LRR-repeat protein 6 n=1 Tax=Malaya genurostris TaxID=325434 RepID=UPI0026F3A9A9|nr:F-box/LRR-repeat protein 6 [Malaya genurostris]XP_058457888.1 F-box/LRR-repeat protein 6 [Malaya genurostris]XP_058457889.1 F-box/LRR-repeat protein 6 [Malaya genurostris]XP_058457891.1 F-box/LRR-repeat protein 6 [Malaya genurostris]XP_058457892.1 F-box/LRR-repeat protein 6 [Malaya genurostris]
METLTESSIATNLRTEPLIPTSPDEERTIHDLHNNNNDDEDVTNPSNLLEDQSQSSQDSSNLALPDTRRRRDCTEETAGSMAKEMHSSGSSDNSCPDAADSQPERDVTENTDSSSIPLPCEPDVSVSPSIEVPPEEAAAIAAAPTPKIHIAPITNGNLLPKSTGKPTTMRDLDRKMNKSRGRPKRRPMVAMYQSEISENKIGIKLCIKKASDAIVQQPKKVTRKRSRKSKSLTENSDEDVGGAASPEKRSRKPRESTGRRTNNNTEKGAQEEHKPPEDQSVWADQLPEHVLCMIFQNAILDEGCIPSLVRFGKVCSAWHRASQVSSLWRTVDLGTWTKERFKTELKLKWLIDNRLRNSTDVSLGNWKVTNVQCVLDRLLAAAPNLVGITLNGWKQLTSEHLMFLVQEFKSLRRIDLSSINAEVNANKTAVGQVSLCNAISEMGERLTHLYLAHNRLSGIPQIVKALSTQCPNMILLDLSNVSTIAVSHGILNIEQLQHGCQKLKVLRITNSHINLSTATLQEQMESPGFPELEELSVASLADESRLFNDEYLQRILKTSTQLKLLDLRGCSRLTHDSLIRLPTWDLKHLFLSGCSITRDVGSGLELIASKWAHSLIEFDLAWANATKPLDDALKALADKGSESPLNHLNLCGSSVSLEAVKEVLTNCPHINSINLSSCRGLPRGVKRLLQGPTEIAELRENLGVTLKQPKLIEA